MRAASALALALCACAPQVDLVALGQKPDAGDTPKDAGVDTAALPDTAPPPPPPRCSQVATSTITLIDGSGTLSEFDPAAMQVAQFLGTPTCLQPPPGPTATSVAVEPNGNIWLTIPQGKTIVVDRATNACGGAPQHLPAGADALAFGRVGGAPEVQADDFFVLLPLPELIELTPAFAPANAWKIPPEFAPPPPASVMATGDGRVFLVGQMPDGMLGISVVYAPDKVGPPSELKNIPAKDYPPTAVVPWKNDLFLFGGGFNVQVFHPSTGIVDPPIPLKAIAPIVGAGVSTCAWP